MSDQIANIQNSPVFRHNDDARFSDWGWSTTVLFGILWHENHIHGTPSPTLTFRSELESGSRRKVSPSSANYAIAVYLPIKSD